jgi:uncharacterized protein YsxB (DUF464 family)
LVEIHLREDSRGRLSSFYANGHAGWEDDGRDVVCAAVSALLQSAWFGLTDVAHVEVTASRTKGSLELSWPESARDDVAARAIVETAARSVERIAQQFPKNVRVTRARNDG